MKLLKQMGLVAAIGLSAPVAGLADESVNRPTGRSQSDPLVKRAFDSRDKNVMDMVRAQERKNGKEGLKDPQFRRKLKKEIELVLADDESVDDTEGTFCASCREAERRERPRSGLSESEVASVRRLIARGDSNPPATLPTDQNYLRISDNRQYGGGFFNTQGSSDMMLMQMFASLMGQGQMNGGMSYGYGQNMGQMFGGANSGYGQNYGFGQNYGYQQNFGFGQNSGFPSWMTNSRYNQAPAFAGGNYGLNYGQAPAFATPVNYSGIISNHSNLINNSGAPAVIRVR